MQAEVRLFMKTFGQNCPTVPAFPDEKIVTLRKRLIEEEYKETCEAIEANDITGVADGIADMLYVVLGMAVAFGINIDPIFAEVHRSNMSKVWPDGKVHKDEYGKVIKSPEYSPADVQSLVAQQMTPDESPYAYLGRCLMSRVLSLNPVLHTYCNEQCQLRMGHAGAHCYSTK